MKIQIWIKREDAVSGDITVYHTHLPQVSYNNYVQVSISQDEFAALEDVDIETIKKINDTDLSKAVSDLDMRDTIEDGGGWLVKQYNRNRDHKSWVKSKEDIPYIYERNPDSGKIRSRPAGSTVTENREHATQKIGERDYSMDKGLEQLTTEMEKKTSTEFTDWFHKLTKNEQTKLAAYYND